MIFIEADSKEAAFYFACEEYFMQHINEPVLMIWQTNPCVMLGRYQIAAAEIDLNYAQKIGMQIVRRPSGGGTIFTDPGTLLYSFIRPDWKPETARKTVAGLVVKSLQELGVNAEAKGRNDILIRGRKIAGLAQHRQYSKLCCHGSMLFDADLEMLTRVLQVDNEKIISKAIPSVRSRVCNINDHIQIEDFKKIFTNRLVVNCQAQKYTLSDNEIKKINVIRIEKYNNPTWTYGETPRFTFHNSKRFEGGKIEIFLDVKNNIIVSCKIYGDFLGIAPVQELESLLEGQIFTQQSINNAICTQTLQYSLGSITKEQFLLCIFDYSHNPS